jgi:hypothetical protein
MVNGSTLRLVKYTTGLSDLKLPKTFFLIKKKISWLDVLYKDRWSAIYYYWVSLCASFFIRYGGDVFWNIIKIQMRFLLESVKLIKFKIKVASIFLPAFIYLLLSLVAFRKIVLHEIVFWKSIMKARRYWLKSIEKIFGFGENFSMRGIFQFPFRM